MQSSKLKKSKCISKPKQLGFCLPCHGMPDGGTQSEGSLSASQTSNPFPYVNLQGAHTLMPIQAFWFPGQDKIDALGLLLFGAHEAIHLWLVNSPFSMNVLWVIHLQMVGLFQVFSGEGKVSIPSLSDPSGFIAEAQENLLMVEKPMALVHELMANSLVMFCAEHNTLRLILSLARQFADPNVNRMEETSGPLLDGGSWDYSLLKSEAYMAIQNGDPNMFARVPIVPQDGERVCTIIRRTWLPVYGKLFRGYGFARLHDQLLGAWRKIANKVEDTDENSWQLWKLLLVLSRYPFDIPLPTLVRGGFQWRSEGEYKSYIARYVGRMHNEPLRRLAELLTVVTEASGVFGIGQWIGYLSAQLPGFAKNIQDGQLTLERYNLAPLIETTWRSYENHAMATLFKHLYSEPLSAWSMFKLPPFDERCDERALNINRLAAIFEAVRQSLIAYESPTCLCAPSVRNSCRAKELLGLLWANVIPDSGYEDWFEENL